MYHVFYFFLTLFSCIVGALGGFGGGIIIKPAMDFVGEFPLANIGILSAITVLTMTVVSIWKMRIQLRGFPIRLLILLGVGSVVGGSLGSEFFHLLCALTGKDQFVGTVQSLLLITMTTAILFVELRKHTLPRKNDQTAALSLGLGFILGTISSFLGIGGGPFNKPALYFFMGLDSKAAAVGSLIIVFLSQFTNVTQTAITKGLSSYDLSALPYMMIGAILGGLLGGIIVNRISERFYDKLFIGVICLILTINCLNLIKYLT